MTEAEVNLVPQPKVRGLLVPQFDTLASAMDAVAPCLEMRPSAVEVMDQLLLEMSFRNLALKDVMTHFSNRIGPVLMVEFSSDDPKEVADNVERLRRRLGEVKGVIGQTLALDPAIRDP
jgi:FAD/FMN-containing dehydrogenase